MEHAEAIRKLDDLLQQTAILRQDIDRMKKNNERIANYFARMEEKTARDRKRKMLG